MPNNPNESGETKKEPRSKCRCRCHCPGEPHEPRLDMCQEYDCEHCKPDAKPQPSKPTGTEKEFKSLEFHSLALGFRKFFDDREEFVTDTVCGHLAIHTQELLAAERAKAIRECAFLVKEASLDKEKDKRIHLECAAKILNKLNQTNA